MRPAPDAPLPPHLDPRGRHRGRPKIRRRGFVPALLTVLTLVSVGLLLLSGYVWYTFRDINNNLQRVDVKVGKAPTSAPVFTGSDQNILLVGNDDRTNMTDAEVAELHVGRDGGSLATDTMMIVHVPADGSRATLISLPRDSYVDIAGYGWGKLNSAYADAYTNTSGTIAGKRAAGSDLLVSTVQDLTGLTITHYMQISLLGFYRISNAIGGITVNMCASVTEPNSGIDLHKGLNTIKGASALAFVRQRYGFPNGLGDLDRVRRQQYFLTAAFRQVASVGLLFKLRSLGNAITSSVFADGSLKLVDLATQLENLSADNITGKTIPTSFANLPDGTSILHVDPTAVRAFIRGALDVSSGPSGTPTATTPSHSATAPAAGSSSGHPAKTKTPAPSAIDAKCIY